MEDFPLKNLPTDIADWSENYALAGYDPAAGVGLFFHIGRWRKDLSLWRQLVVVALPGDEFIVSRAIGNGMATDTGPGSAHLGVKIIEDGRRQLWHFLGGAHKLPGSWLRSNLIKDGPMERLEFALDFSSTLPLWVLGKAGQTSAFAGHGHTEQIGRLQGNISFGGQNFKIDAAFNRDHSRGPRLLKDDFIRHIWFQGIFANGVKFYAYEAHETDEVKPTFSQAAVVINDVMHEAQLHLKNPLPSADGLAHIFAPIAFVFEYAGGKLEGEVTSYPTSSYHQATAPWDSYLGACQLGDSPARKLMEQSALYRLADGTTGYGHIERTVPGWLLRDSDLP